MRQSPLLIALFFLPFICCLLACGVSKKGSYQPQKKYAPAAMQHDAALVWDTYQNNHPNLFWYISPDSLQLSYQKLQASLVDSLTEEQFRLRLAQWVALIGCGHTSVRPPKHAFGRIGGQQIPVQVKILLGDSMVLIAMPNGKDANFVRGVAISSINGRSARQIIDTLCTFISTDGRNNSFRYQYISGNFQRLYRAVFGQSAAYEIKYFDMQQVERSIILTAGIKPTTNARNVNLAIVQPPPKPPVIKQHSLRIDTANRLAVMEINTFQENGLRHFFRKSFKTLEQLTVKHLVVELRQNGGGDIMKSTLLTRYLTRRSFKVADTVAAYKMKFPHPTLVHLRVVYQIQALFATHKGADGLRHFGFFERHSFSPKRRFHYNGEIYLITGGNTFSAATLVVAALQGQSKVSVIGEETGGGNYGTTAISIPDLFLPNTKVRVRLPLYRVVIKKDSINNGRGILPDVVVPSTSWHLAQRMDPKIQKIYEMINRKPLNGVFL